MIDAVIVDSPWTPRDWVHRCIESVAAAIKQSPVDVTLHLSAGVPHSIGEAKYQAYRRGEYPYVVIIDDDDWVTPEFFQAIQPAWLDAGIRGVFVGEMRVYPDGRSGTMLDKPHKLSALRRDVAESVPLSQHARGEGKLIAAAVQEKPHWRWVQRPLYCRRIRYDRNELEAR